VEKENQPFPPLGSLSRFFSTHAVEKQIFWSQRRTSGTGIFVADSSCTGLWPTRMKELVSSMYRKKDSFAATMTVAAHKVGKLVRYLNMESS
jgi:hypothetical protein